MPGQVGGAEDAKASDEVNEPSRVCTSLFHIVGFYHKCHHFGTLAGWCQAELRRVAPASDVSLQRNGLDTVVSECTLNGEHGEHK